MEEVLTASGERPASLDPRWWETPGLLRTALVQLDVQVGTVVNVEKRVVDPAVVSGEVAGQLGRLAQQMGLGAGGGTVEPSSSATGFEPVTLGFTRQAGSIRRRVNGR